MEFVLNFIKDLFDDSKKVVTKIYWVVTAILLLLFANNTFDFVHSYRTSDKLEHLEKINIILSDTTLTHSQYNELQREKNYIINHKTIFENTYNLLNSVCTKISSLNFSFSLPKQQIETKSAVDEKDDDKIEKDFLMHFLSSNLLIILLLIAFTAIAIKETIQGKNSIGVNTITLLAVWTILLIIAFICSKILDVIPILFHRPSINYFLNFVLSTATWLSIFLSIGSKRKR